MVASGVRFEIHAQLRVPWGVARGTRRAPFATSSATRLTCAGALAFAAPPPKKEAMLLCPLIAARKAVRVPREQALQKGRCSNQCQYHGASEINFAGPGRWVCCILESTEQDTLRIPSRGIFARHLPSEAVKRVPSRFLSGRDRGASRISPSPLAHLRRSFVAELDPPAPCPHA